MHEYILALTVTTLNIPTAPAAHVATTISYNDSEPIGCGHDCDNENSHDVGLAVGLPVGLILAVFVLLFLVYCICVPCCQKNAGPTRTKAWRQNVYSIPANSSSAKANKGSSGSTDGKCSSMSVDSSKAKANRGGTGMAYEHSSGWGGMHDISDYGEGHAGSCDFNGGYSGGGCDLGGGGDYGGGDFGGCDW